MNATIRGNRFLLFVFFLLSATLWIYLFMRARGLNILDDEGQTLRFYVQNCRPFIWQSGYIGAPNNHFLNSVLSIISTKIFGYSNLTLRLPSLLFFPLFAAYIYKISGLLRNKWLTPIFWIALLGAHFLIEFFAYSRGYAMGNTLMLAGAFHGMRFWQEKKHKDLLITVVALTLGMSANLNLLWCTGLIAILISFSLKQTPTLRTKKTYRLVALLWGGFFAFVGYAFYLKVKNQLYIGTDHGIASGLDSLVPILTPLPAGHPIIYTLFSLILLLLFLFSILHDKQLASLSPATFFFLLFAANIGSTIFMVYFLDSKMPIGRTILHWYPLFVMSIFFALDRPKHKWLAALALPFLAIPFKSYTQINTERVTTNMWSEEFVPETLFAFTDSLYNAQQTIPFVATNLGSYKHILDFQTFKKNGQSTVVNFSDYPIFTADYQVINFRNYDQYKGLYNVLSTDSFSGTTLLKRKDLLKRKMLQKQRCEAYETSDEFYRIFRVYRKNIQEGGLLLFTFSLHIDASGCFDGILSAQGKNGDKPTNFWWQSSLGALTNKWNGSKVTLTLPLESFPAESEYLDVYLWNIARDPYRLNKAHLQIDLLY